MERGNRPATRRRQLDLTAIVLGRGDFRETSRVVTLLTREEGRLLTLAKGAHRPTSPCLGKVDLLNTVRVRVSWREGTMPLLGRINLLHEPRSLRQPSRFLVATRLVELARASTLDERPDPELFDLLEGGSRLLARCPEAGMPPVWTGWQLRLLRHLGRLPQLDRCSECGGSGPVSWWPEEGELRCRKHAPHGSHGLPPGAQKWLQVLDTTPGSRWHQVLPTPASSPVATAMLNAWLRIALDQPLPILGRLGEINA